MCSNDPNDKTETRYVFGHSVQELARLERQGRQVAAFTNRFFSSAGIERGMRVLDVGCGGGDVSILLADLVGPQGSVVGVDRVPQAIATASTRTQALGLANVSFVQSDLLELSFDEAFDAATGRYVLMFQPDPAAVLRRVGEQVRPDGIVVFHEIDWNAARSHPSASTYDQCVRWIVETIRRGSANPYLAAEFGQCFAAAGLPEPEMAVEGLIGAGSTASDAVTLLTDLIASVAAEAERLGVVTEGEVQIDTLSERALNEVIRLRSVVYGRAEVGAWCRIP